MSQVTIIAPIELCGRKGKVWFGKICMGSQSVLCLMPGCGINHTVIMALLPAY
jgi:hypothetical protein